MLIWPTAVNLATLFLRRGELPEADASVMLARDLREIRQISFPFKRLENAVDVSWAH